MLSWQPIDRFQVQHSYKGATIERTDKQTNKIGAGIKLKKEHMLGIKIKFS